MAIRRTARLEERRSSSIHQAAPNWRNQCEKDHQEEAVGELGAIWTYRQFVTGLARIDVVISVSRKVEYEEFR